MELARGGAFEFSEGQGTARHTFLFNVRQLCRLEARAWDYSTRCFNSQTRRAARRRALVLVRLPAAARWGTSFAPLAAVLARARGRRDLDLRRAADSLTGRVPLLFILPIISIVLATNNFAYIGRRTVPVSSPIFTANAETERKPSRHSSPRCLTFNPPHLPPARAGL